MSTRSPPPSTRPATRWPVADRPVAEQTTELLIGGMTCASCAARVEKKLNRLDGVTATVNYATEKAHVRYADGVSPDDLIATVEKTGYTATVRPRPEARPELARGEEDGVL